jgi:ABC-type uncharacterized transport system substrate-binding protein
MRSLDSHTAQGSPTSGMPTPRDFRHKHPLFVHKPKTICLRCPGFPELAAQSRLPAVYPGWYFVKAGGLLAYDVNQPAIRQRLSSYVDKIFHGVKPGDVPVEQPTKFELVINLKTAKALGLTIPQSLLNRADEVIQ